MPDYDFDAYREADELALADQPTHVDRNSETKPDADPGCSLCDAYGASLAFSRGADGHQSAVAFTDQRGVSHTHIAPWRAR